MSSEIKETIGLSDKIAKVWTLSFDMFVMDWNICSCFGLCDPALSIFGHKNLADMKQLRTQTDFNMNTEIANFFLKQVSTELTLMFANFNLSRLLVGMVILSY